MPQISKDFIPHQLGLTQAQINKLIAGKPVNIPHHTMGAGAGESVILLKPQNARKLLTAYKKGKGMRLTMHPHEVESSLMEGRGFFSSLKKGLKKVGKVAKEVIKSPIVKQIGKDVIQHGSEAIGTAIGAYTGNPQVGMMIGSTLGRAGSEAIDKGGVRHGVKSLKNDARAVGLEILDDQIQKLPPAYRKSAELALAGEYPDAVNNIIEHEYGSFKETGGYGLKKKGGPKKGGPKKGSAEMKEKMARLRAMRKTGGKINLEKALNPKKNGLSKIGKPLASTLIHAGIPAVMGIAGDALGGPLGGVAGAVAGDMVANQVGKTTGYGVKRGRGRPRKVGGDVASMSAPYKQALRLNYGGLELNNISPTNQPLNNFTVNSRVKPSSSEMTLSPYARMDSPAMNPFIPTTYVQSGGTSCGYGGKGLYGKGLYGM